jgi:hypothetical protein
VVWVMILIANGRLSRLFVKLSLFFHSQVRVAVVGLLLVAFSAFLNCLAAWIQMRRFPVVAARPFDVPLFILNIPAPLIEIGLLVWLMPQDRKASKRARFLSR